MSLYFRFYHMNLPKQFIKNNEKKFRKPKPSPPHWYWWDSDNCWDCNNRNNCGGKGCKRLKEIKAKENERR